MNMIRSRSTLAILSNDNAGSVSEKSNLGSPPRLIRSSSYHRPNERDSPSKMSDDGNVPSQPNVPKSTSASSHRFLKWFVLLVFVGAAVYFFIVVYFGALFIRDVDVIDISEPHFEKKNQVTVLINTFKRKDMVHGKDNLVIY